MSISFPTSLDSFANPVGTDLLENATAALDHDVQHSNANDAIEALEAKVGANGSAVTTSHDYKLSGITGTDKALSSGTGGGSQTITDLTLVDPIFTLGGDATGDMFYRNSGGLVTRLPIGTAAQIIQVSAGGIPEWVANPSASPASTTQAGIVELATTAETEIGTDATRAVTPDGLHDMATLAGASWFLDEDTMVSDSAIKTVSQQSVKAYIDNNTLSTSPTSVTWQTIQLDSPNNLTGTPWTISATTISEFLNGSTLFQSGSINTDSYAYTTSMISLKTGAQLPFSSTIETKIRIRSIVIPGTGTGIEDRYQFFGYTEGSGSENYASPSNVEKRIGFGFYNGNIYAICADGSAVTATSVLAYSAEAMKTYQINVNGTTSVEFYIDGVLEATISTNLPTSGNCQIQFTGLVGTATTDSGFKFISNMTFTEKLT